MSGHVVADSLDQRGTGGAAVHGGAKALVRHFRFLSDHRVRDTALESVARDFLAELRAWRGAVQKITSLQRLK